MAQKILLMLRIPPCMILLYYVLKDLRFDFKSKMFALKSSQVLVNDILTPIKVASNYGGEETYPITQYFDDFFGSMALPK